MARNNSEGKPYYTQRNNRIRPGSSCGVTAMVAALSAAGWDVDGLVPGGVQPEDALLRFIMTDGSTLGVWKRLDPEGRTPPNEWHAVLAHGTNRWLKSCGLEGSPVVFREAVSAGEIRAAVDAGGAAVISGRFAQADGTEIDHVVTVAGYDGDGWIIDDPWGDYRDGYRTHCGNDIPLPAADFAAKIKPQGKAAKWAHTVQAAPGAAAARGSFSGNAGEKEEKEEDE